MKKVVVGIGRDAGRVIGVDPVIVRGGRERQALLPIGGVAGEGRANLSEVGPVDGPVNVETVLVGIVARPGHGVPIGVHRERQVGGRRRRCRRGGRACHRGPGTIRSPRVDAADPGLDIEVVAGSGRSARPGVGSHALTGAGEPYRFIVADSF